MLRRSAFPLIVLALLLHATPVLGQTCNNTGLGTNCTRSNFFFGEILPNAGCGVFNDVVNYGAGNYFRMPVLQGGCYTVSTCGAPFDTQLGAFQGAATTNPFAYDDDNGPECTGTSASMVMVPGFTDYANIDVRQYNCQVGAASSITVRVRQNNNLAITSPATAMCQGNTRPLTATPARVTVSPQPNSGDVGTFSGTGVSGTTFIAPVPSASQQAYTLSYNFGYCSTTQAITVFRNPSAAVAEADKIVCPGSAPISATAPAVGTGSWSVVSGTGLSFANANSASTTVSGLPASGTVTLRWTVTNGPCTATTDDLVLTIGTTLPTGPSAATACEGNNATFTAGVSGSTDSLRWFRSTDGGSSWLLVGNGGGTSGATTTSLSYGPVALAQQGNLFRLQAYACGSSTPVSSSSAALTIAREINVTGLGNNIVDGDLSPIATDGTDYGNVINGGSLVRSFTIQNLGFTNLALTGITSNNPRFVVSAPTMPGFLAVGASYTFTVTFSPNVLGPSSATIIVNNDDCFESSYDFLVQGVSISPQTRFYVDHTATGANNGTSWANAFTSFQSAVAAAVSGDTVLVAKGVHYPQAGAARRKKFTLVNGVRYYGGFPNGGGTFAQRNFTTNRTVLSGDIGAANDSLDNCFVVVDASNLTNATLMSGFTVERGNADSLGFHLFSQAGGINLGSIGGMRMDSLTLRNNFGRSAGAIFAQGSSGLVMRGCTLVTNNSLSVGGAYIDTGSFIVLNSLFQSNTGGNGGAMLFNGTATITSCNFFNNRASANGGAINGAPGSTFTLCNFTGNTSNGDGGAFYRFGGAATTFIDCAFLQNIATRGGGINSINGGVNLTRCIFRENQATTNQGGGLYNNIATSTLTNCVFWKNAALASAGGAIYNNTGGTLNILSCTFNGNTAATGAGALNNNSTSNANVNNSIFWGNLTGGNDVPASSEITIGSGSLGVNYSIWQNGTPGPTVYNCNPYFIDPVIGDLRLQTCSNAIEMGTATGAPANDILGSPRPFDGDAMGGAGYDLGAYESQSVCNPVVWYVDQTAVGCNNGRYWGDAFTDLKSALRVAGTGDSIFVATGTYKPDQGTNSRDSAFVLKSNLTLLGGFPNGGSTLAGRNWVSNQVRLSGAIGTAATTDNSYHVLKATSVSGTTLDGFYVQDGYANGAAALDQQGGGLSQVASYVATRFVSFENNFASVRGGGAYHDGGGNPTYNNVRFSGNSSDKGGGAYFVAATFVRNAIFRNNSATTYGGGLCMVVNQNVNQSTFKDNVAPAGAGVYFEGGGSNKLHNCILWGNTGGQDVQGIGQIEVKSSIIEDGTPANCVGCSQVYTTNPQFTNADGQLSACSPAVDLGNATLPNLPAIDFLGTTRPLDGDGINGTAYDLGAFESALACNVTRLYVDSSAVAGLNLGNSWPNAYLSLQSAIANAGPGDTIWVAKGNYFPSVPAGRGATFVLNNGVKIFGGFPSGGSAFAGRNPATNRTVLNGDLGVANDSLDNAYHIVTVSSGATNTALLDGFTLTKALSNGGGTNNFGGGIYCVNASPRISACLITRNTAASGGGGYFENANALLTNVRFERNWGRGAGFASGGGVALAGSAGADFVRCTFLQNRVINGSGTGGAATIDLAVNANFTNCEFIENSANNGQGGAVRISQGSASAFFTNCLFRANSAGTNEGGALYADLNCSATLSNCTFYGQVNASNHAVVAGNSGANVTVQNSIFGTTTDQAFRAAGTLTLSSCVYPVGTCPIGATCTGLLPVAPGFVAAPANLRLAPSSSAINAGSNAFLVGDAFDVDGDLNLGEPTPDLDLNARLFGSNVDIGAYELQCQPALIGTSPSNASTCPNGSATFTASVVNTSDSLRWQVSTNGGSTWSLLANGGPISGATTTTLSINPASVTLNGYQYRLLVYSCGALSSTSNAATLSTADLTPPVASCAPATVYLGAAGTGTLAAAQANAGSTDNCGGVTLAVSPSSFTCAQIGIQSATLTVTDGSGNSSTCTASITVSDTIRPVISCANPTLYLNGTGTASLSAAIATASATDNCGIASASVMPNSFDCGDVFSNRLVWSAQTNLRRSTLTGASQQNFVSYASTQVTMAYVPVKDSIYLADFTARKIRRVHVSGGPITDIKTNVDPFGIAVDPIGGKIYWADPNANTISRCDLNGGNTQVIVSGTADTDYSRMIKLDLLNGKMYWTDANQGFIKRANLDGTGIQTLVTGMGNIVGLALDPVGNKMYYSSYSFNDIRRANLDGTGVTTIVSGTTLPLGMDLDLVNGKIYWVNGSGTNTVRSANFNGSGQTLVASGIPTPYDLFVVPPTPTTLTVTDNSGNTSTCTALVTVADTTRPTALCRPATVVLNAAGTGSTTAAAIDNGSTDACGIFSYSLSTTSFTCANIGANTVTLSVTDPSGNVGTCTATVTVLDQTAPNAVCQNTTVNLNASGIATVTPAMVNNGSTDACGIGGLALSQSTFNCAQRGNNTVTLTVTDVNGNSSTCTATVTVVDNTPPTMLCQNITVHLNPAGTVTITPLMIDGGTTDNCAINARSANPNTFTCSNIGPNNVTLVANDQAGNSNTCTAIVTVVDTVRPVANCQNVTLYLDAAGNALLSPAAVNNGSTDACGIASMGVTPDAFTCANIGSNAVTLAVTDPSSNSSTCTAIVTVVDTVSPIATCQAVTAYLDAAGNASISAAQVNAGSMDACGIASSTASPSSFTCSNLGSNTVTLTLVDQHGNTSSCTATVTVQDSVAPIAVCSPGTVSLDATGNGSIAASVIGLGSSDNCGSFTASVSPGTFTCADLGANNVTLTLTDGSGNTDTCVATVTVQDVTPPVVVCNNAIAYLDAAGNGAMGASVVGLGTADACGPFTASLSPSTFTCANVGPNTVTLTATDPAGNSASCTAIVTVLDTIAPSLTCQGLTVLLDSSGNGSVTVGQVGSAINDACGIASSSVSPNAFTCANVGSNTVTLSATDINGNSASCTATVMVLDSVNPVVNCQPVTVHLNNAGTASISVAQVSAGITDACGIASSAVSPSSFTCANVGSNTVTLSATDANGNTATCTAIVTVMDTVIPIVNCQPATVYLNASGNGSVSVAQVDAGSSDACGISFSSVTPSPFTCANVGNNTVILEATDINGNSASCTAIVTVLDTIAPALTCQGLTVLLDSSGNGAVTVGQVGSAINDACGIASSSVSPNAFTCANVGSNTVTLSATDINGNSASCTATVMVLDSVNPVVNCQPVTVHLNNAGTASISVAQVSAGITDACGSASSTVSPSSFTCANVGSNTATLSATDINGNTASCTAIVTVVDTVIPIVNCQPATVYLNASGNGAVSVAQVDAGSSDACGIAFSSVTPSPFTCANVGNNTVTLAVTDVNGNSASCTAIVTVLDTIAPSLICQGLTVLLDSSGNGAVTVGQVGSAINDACGIASSSVSPNAFTCANVGPNTVTLSATDVNGNSASCTATVMVLDSVNPVVNCQPVTVHLNNAGTASVSVAQVSAGITDACGSASSAVSPSSFTCANVGSNTVTLSATDINGNTASCTAIVTVVDTVDPVVSCQNMTLYLNAAGTRTLAATQVLASTSDACGTPSLSVSPSVYTCAQVGTNTAVLTATDANGNTATCNATVTVIDTVRPAAVCQFASLFLDATGSITILPSRIDANSNDACGIATRTISQSTFTCANLGNNTVTLTVVDVNGNSSICNTVVVVRDTVRPVAVCQPTTLYLNSSGTATLAPASINNGSFDACGIATFTVSTTSFTCANVGPNAVTLTATDVRNNTGTCVATVTVLDTVRPSALCQAATLYLDANGQATLGLNAVDAGSSDACGIQTRSLSATTFGCAQVGTNSVTLTVQDNNGNQQQCTAAISVMDTVRPTAICQPATVYLDAQGQGSLSSAAVDAGSGDACGVANRAVSPATYTCAEIGANPAILTVTDLQGNSQQCSTTVTVLDTVAPAAVCQPVTVYLDALGDGGTTASVVGGGSNDACGIDSLVLSATDFTCNDVGTQSLTLSVLDAHGNSSSCAAAVTVMDTIAPALACQSTTIYLGTQGQVVLADTAVTAWVLDACGVDTLLLSQHLFACADTGQNQVTLTAVDIHGNARSCIATVTVVPDPFVVQLNAVVQSCGFHVSCAGAQDGTAEALPGGGCAPYTYAWSTGASSPQISGLTAGAYTVTITDGIGRVYTDTVVLSAPDPVLPNALAATTVCAGDTSGYVDLSPSGGNGCQGYSFLWHTGATTEDLSNLGAGAWSVTVTDPTGCQGQQSGLITSIPNPQPSLGPDVLKCAEDSVVLNPGGYFAYLWSAGSTANSYVASQPGTYWVLVTDSIGCAGLDSIVITDRSTQQAFVTATGPSPLCIGDTAILDAGAGFSGYLWSTGATTAAISVTGTAATFTVTATDSFGCMNVDSSEVIFFNAPKPNPIILPNGNVALCAGGTVVLDASPGYFSYQWNTGGSTSQISVGSPGVYGVTVSNGFGCVGSAAPVTVVQVPLPQPTISFVNDTLWTDPIWVSYQWYFNGAAIPGASLSHHVPIQDGIYSVVVTNGDGCEGESIDLSVQLVAVEDDRNTIHGLSLYPNPARGGFYLTTLRPIDWNLTVTITDMYGRRLKQYQMAHLVHDTGFDISDLAAGPYLVEIETQKGQRKVFRLVVQ